MIREESRLSKSLIASSVPRRPAEQRRAKVEVGKELMSSSLNSKDSNSKDLNNKDLDSKDLNNKDLNSKGLNSKDMNSKEGPKRFESLLCNLRKLGPKQKSWVQPERTIIETESSNTTLPNRAGLANSKRRHTSTSTMKLNQKVPTATKPPVPEVRPTRQPICTTSTGSIQFTPITSSRISRVSSPVAAKAARNEQTLVGKGARNEERTRTQSLSEMKVKQHSSSSCAGRTNATRSRLYVQRKTPAANSNNGSVSVNQQVREEETRVGRSSSRQEMLGGSRSKSVSSVLSGREEGIENVRRGTQIQRAVGAGRSASSAINKKTKEFSYREKTCGKRGPISKSIPNLCSQRQHLEESEKKPVNQSDQVDTLSSRSYPHNWEPAGCSSTTDKKKPTQGSEMSRVCRRARERKNSEAMKSLPRETDLAFRRPSIHQSLININQECEEVSRQIFAFVKILFFFFR